MLRKANNVFSVLLGDVSVTTAALNSAVPVGTVVTNTALPAGAVVITDAGLRRLDAAAYAALGADAQIFVVQGRGATQPLMKSPILTKGNLKFTIAPHRRARQQVTAVGYNGTTGALPVANNTDFWIKIRKRDNDAANRSQPFSLFAGPVKTDGTGTQAELASLLVKNGYLNFKNEPANQYLRFEALCDNAGAATTAATGTLAATNGSRFVSATVSGAAEFAVGDYVRFGTATTSPVYKVTATAVAGITLDSPYVGTTGTFAAGAAEFITAALAAVANFGVRVTGNEDPFDVNQWRDYYANRFTVSFSDSTTPITHLLGAYNGNGVWQQVAMDEYLSYGYEGENNQLAVPSIPRDQVVKIPGVAGNTVNTSKYSALNISWEESISGLVSMDGGKGNVLVYFNLDNSAPGAGVVTAGAAEANTITTLGLAVASFNEV
jgi:hypothetical protein